MKKTIILTSLFLLGIKLYAQDTIKVNLYNTTDDYKAKKHSKTNVPLIVKDLNKDYIFIKKFIDNEAKEFRRANTSWAISYNGNTYFNLGYSSDLNNWKLFLRLDVEGSNFCASFITDSTANIVKNSGNYYGGGLTGVMLKESTKWGTNWKTKDDKKVKLFFIDLNKQSNPIGNRNKGSIGAYITKKDLNELLELKLSKEDLDNLKFEEAIALLNEKN